MRKEAADKGGGEGKKIKSKREEMGEICKIRTNSRRIKEQEAADEERKKGRSNAKIEVKVGV